jgi:hypothetical protein
MRNKIFFASITFLLSLTVQAQLTNSKWTGIVHIQSDEDDSIRAVKSYWNFGKDTLQILLEGESATSSTIEVLSYHTIRNILFMKKARGGSACPIGTDAKANFQIKEDKLLLLNNETACDAYKIAIDKNASFVRVK